MNPFEENFKIGRIYSTNPFFSRKSYCNKVDKKICTFGAKTTEDSTDPPIRDTRRLNA